ncbi:MAG: sulfoxide reductase heme-binding subunit YedZ [Hyphomicrobiales bacterium]|nr:sulfoxide reductase heme-binding subunit YedZ [Hyphomicrobiales bacterium]
MDTANPRKVSAFALWRDRAGAFSAVRAFALLLACAPAVPLLLRIATQDLGPRPLTEVSHVTGLWTIRLLAATLAVTPLIALTRKPRLAPARRILGVAVFVWMVAHFIAFVADKMFDPVVVAREIVLRVYLFIGFAAFLALGVLAATSTDAMVARLGAARWRRLHLLVYAVALLGLAHFFMQSKQDVSEPTALAGVFAMLGMMRLARRAGFQLTPSVALIVAVIAASGTALCEAGYFVWKFGAPIATALQADFDFSYEIRPCWLPLAVGLALALVGLASKVAWPERVGPRAPKEAPSR